MTAPDDLIRRGDAERAAISYHPADGSCCHEDPTGHHAAVWACDGIAERIRALPADPVAEAAGKLAQATDAMEDECCGAGISKYLAANGWTDSEAAFNRMLSALDAYRAAVAARSAGTVPPAPKPAPACARCGGSGATSHRVGSDFAGYSETIPCPECRGKP